MTGSPRLSPGPAPATPGDLRAAQERDRLLRAELPRVREAALAWRNGLGVLLAGLIGFGLVKGRSDISQLASAWAAAVGFLLLAALIAGTAGALLLVRAAHGSPLRAPARNPQPARIADHIEALAAAGALRLGVLATVSCTLLLVAAVGTTWYGPAREKPSILVQTPTGPVCGAVVRLDRGVLVLKTAGGEQRVNMRTAKGLASVDAC
ncbi:hypothetical protein ACWF9B_03145 [Streptomyces sp. NPDC055089]